MNLDALTDKNILIYGANGYTGRLMARTCKEYGLSPILAGRSDAVAKAAIDLDLDYTVFEVHEAKKELSEIDFLINTAGPFRATQGPLMDACIETSTHYIDVCGKWKEVDRAIERDQMAREAGVVLLPSAGFGIAPPDIAAQIALSTIEEPESAFTVAATYGKVSRGTLFSMLSEINEVGTVWRKGANVLAHPAEEAVEIELFGTKVKGVNNPLRADLRTVPHATKVPNYQSFMKLPNFAIAMMNGKLGWLRKFLLSKLHWLPEGPNEKQLKSGHTLVYAEARNQQGNICRVHLKGPEAYLFSVDCVLLAINKIVRESAHSGFCTPSLLIGEEIGSIKGAVLRLFND